MRVLSGRPVRLGHKFLDDEDVLTLSTVNVTLTDSVGVEVASSPATLDTDGETWNVSFAAQPLGVYTVTWTGDVATDTTFVEVVGNYLFSIPEARLSDDYLRDAEAFPAAEIRQYREVVEGEFEQITGRSFVERVTDRVFEGDGSRVLITALLPDAREILGVWVDGVEVDDFSGWKVSPLGAVTAPDCVEVGATVRVRIRYGFRVPPAPIARAGMVRLRSLLAEESSGIPDRATTWQPAEGGTFRLATPGAGKWRTGIPAVDSTLADYSLDVVLAVAGIV